MKTKAFLFFLAFAATSGSVSAASRSITLNIQNMTCAVCPITVKKALEHVPGVEQVSVDFAGKTATVQFNDTKTTVDKLTEATKTAGYPSFVNGDGK